MLLFCIQQSHIPSVVSAASHLAGFCSTDLRVWFYATTTLFWLIWVDFGKVIWKTGIRNLAVSSTAQIIHVTQGTDTVSPQCLLRQGQLASPLLENWVSLGLVLCNKLGCLFHYFRVVLTWLFRIITCQWFQKHSRSTVCERDMVLWFQFSFTWLMMFNICLSVFCPLVFSLEKGVFQSIFSHKKINW